MGDHTHQWTTLRNLVELLTRLGEDEPAARLIGTVDHRAPVPTFGPEEARVGHEAAAVRARLGARADALMQTGRDDDLDAAIEHALATLERIADVHHQ